MGNGGKKNMKLVYLWIESWNNFKRQGYIFDSAYKVRYDNQRNELTITRRENIDCLLYGDKISVTAVVGDNGAGKSTLLDAIRMILFDKYRREKEFKGFLLYEDEGKLNLFSFMESEPRINPIVLYNKISDVLSDFNLIYYSDFLDIKYYQEDFDDGEDEYTHGKFEDYSCCFRNRDSIQLNISTSYFLRENEKRIMDYFHSDIKKQIYFYESLQGKMNLPFSIPTKLFVKLEFLDIDIFNRVLDASLESYYYMGTGHKGELNTNSYLIGVLKEMKQYDKKNMFNKKSLDPIHILQWDILVIYLYNLVDEYKKEYESIHDYQEIDERVENVISLEKMRSDFWGQLQKIFSDAREEESFEPYLSFYKEIVGYLKQPKNGEFCVVFNFADDIYLSGNRELLEIYMEECGWSGNWDIDIFVKFYECYTKISYQIDFLKFSWGMSSGESSIFNLFARLHHAMKIEPKEKMILLFDELDSSFHPHWQQEIIHYLTEFLRNVYPQKEFQIILTTHSPILLSDIPRENVIFMRKYGIMETNHGQTFAANIASLYYDSFFMKKGSIGEVARKSIGNLMDTISELEEQEKCSKEKNETGQKKRVENKKNRLVTCFLEKQYPDQNNIRIEDTDKYIVLIQKLIDSIGEDIWRYKANEEFHRFLESELEYRKKELLNRLGELKQEAGKEFVEELLEQWMKTEDKR